MKHPINEIHRDHNDLNADQREHIQGCSKCQGELALMQRVETVIARTPLARAPIALRELVFQRLTLPAYRLWHLLFGVVFVVLSPAIYAHYAHDLEGHIDGFVLSGVGVIYATLVLMLVIPMAFQLFTLYEARFRQFKDSCDYYLENGILKIFQR